MRGVPLIIQTNPLVRPFMNLIFDMLPNVIKSPSGSAPINVRKKIKRVNLNPSKSCSVTSRNIIPPTTFNILQFNILHDYSYFVKIKNCPYKGSFFILNFAPWLSVFQVFTNRDIFH